MVECVRLYGEKDGMCYGVPYKFSASTLVVDGEKLGERESWTAEEMMQFVRDSGAEVAVAGYSAPTLFEYLARWLRLVDPEKGESRMDSAEAEELLEFALEFGEKDPDMASGERIQDGSAFVMGWVVNGAPSMEMIEMWFQGREQYIGKPGDIPSSGNLLYTTLFSVNQACAHPEGAVAFLRYLLGEEGQDAIARDAAQWGGTGFPVDARALEAMFGYAAERQNSVEYIQESGSGRGLRPETLEKLRALLASVKPESEPEDEISDILREESEAYFSGQKTAREVCETMQNRVQLYLDERK